MVKDINPTSSNYPRRSGGGGRYLFFTANNGTHGRELWTSDGTPAGTTLVLDMYTGPTGSDPRYVTAVGTTVFFNAETAALGTELWAIELPYHQVYLPLERR